MEHLLGAYKMDNERTQKVYNAWKTTYKDSVIRIPLALKEHNLKLEKIWRLGGAMPSGVEPLIERSQVHSRVKDMTLCPALSWLYTDWFGFQYNRRSYVLRELYSGM